MKSGNYKTTWLNSQQLNAREHPCSGIVWIGACDGLSVAEAAELAPASDLTQVKVASRQLS